jgi:hypothetical protein
MLRVSHGTHEAVIPIIYHSLRITSLNLPAILLGLLNPLSARRFNKTKEYLKDAIEFELPGLQLQRIGKFHREDWRPARAPPLYSRSRLPYPNEASHNRKTRALSHVQSIHFEALPGVKSATILFGCWAYQSAQSANPLLFPNASTFFINSRTTFDFLNWHTVHPSENVHPFLRNFALTMRPQHLCMDYAAINTTLRPR